MNIVSLHTFIAIVETGNLVRASEKMNVTQSTVTARLKTLENEVGQILLNRYKSGTTLTPAGSKLFQYARVMTGLWQQAMNEAGLPDGVDSLCTFGCHTHLWSGPGIKLFNAIKNDHPQMAISVHNGTKDELFNWLTSGIIDVILTFEPMSRGNQSVYQLEPDDLVLVSDRQDGPIRFDPHYIFVDYGEDYRREHGEIFHDAGTAKITFDTPSWGLQYILENGGSGYFPRDLVQPHIDAGQLFFLDKAPTFQRCKYLIINQTTEQNWPWFADLAKTL